MTTTWRIVEPVVNRPSLSGGIQSAQAKAR